MKIRLDVGGTPLTATLDDTETTKGFASLLPTSPIGRRPRVVCHVAASLDGRNVVLTHVDVAVAKSL